MSSNNNDQNFDDEHDFYLLVLAGCAATLTITSFKEKKNLSELLPTQDISL